MVLADGGPVARCRCWDPLGARLFRRVRRVKPFAIAIRALKRRFVVRELQLSGKRGSLACSTRSKMVPRALNTVAD